MRLFRRGPASLTPGLLLSEDANTLTLSAVDYIASGNPRGSFSRRALRSALRGRGFAPTRVVPAEDAHSGLRTSMLLVPSSDHAVFARDVRSATASTLSEASLLSNA